jgi:hypothetical protein
MSDSIRLARQYMGLPPLPEPAVTLDQDASRNAGTQPHPPVEVKLIYAPDYPELLAAPAVKDAPPALPGPLPRRRATPKPSCKKYRPRPSRAVADARDPHERHCTVCNSPDREAIEEEFVHWRYPNSIADHYKIGLHSLYRHAHARNLFAARERKMRFALGNIIQESIRVMPTADSVIRAIRAYSCINREGQWVEPPAQVIVSSGSRLASPPPIDVTPVRRPAALPRVRRTSPTTRKRHSSKRRRN